MQNGLSGSMYKMTKKNLQTEEVSQTIGDTLKAEDEIKATGMKRITGEPSKTIQGRDYYLEKRRSKSGKLYIVIGSVKSGEEPDVDKKNTIFHKFFSLTQIRAFGALIKDGEKILEDEEKH